MRWRRRTRDAVFGRQVFVRGVVEVSNYCRQNCHYCAMRRDNQQLARYRLAADEVADLIIHHRPASITDIDIQTGEDPVAVREFVLPLMRELRRHTDLGITLCLGTLTSRQYDELREAGGEYYVLKIPTHDMTVLNEEFHVPGTFFRGKRLRTQRNSATIAGAEAVGTWMASASRRWNGRKMRLTSAEAIRNVPFQVPGELFSYSPGNMQNNQPNSRRSAMKKGRFLAARLLSVVVAVLGTGCATQRGSPVAAIQMNANMDRTDYQVIGTTTGTSTTVCILGPVVHIIDGNKIQVLGIKFFTDETAAVPGAISANEQGGLIQIFAMIFGTDETDARAYFKALSETPDADAVAGKPFIRKETTVIPILVSKEESTFQGKALVYKVHE
ncbi:MAG: radical SAM protein [Verrucomicrobiia bacterium]